MEANSFLRWLSEHWPTLVNGGLVLALSKVYLDNKRLRSDIRRTDAQTAGAETDNLVKEVGGVTSVIAVYKESAHDFADRWKELKDENKSLRGQVKRREKHIEHLEQEAVLLREMKGLPPISEDKVE